MLIEALWLVVIILNKTIQLVISGLLFWFMVRWSALAPKVWESITSMQKRKD